MNEVTKIIQAVRDGRQLASAELLPLVYTELRELAAIRLSSELPGQTLQATALVHEAYLRLLGSSEFAWENRGHFFAAAAEAMRRILIDHARARRRIKRGGDQKRLALKDIGAVEDMPPEELLALDEALKRLEAQDSTKAQLVKLRFFAGLTVEQAAAALDISRATADRYWSFARAWLFHEIVASMDS